MPDDVVDPVRLHRDPAVPGPERRLQRVAHRDVGLDRDHVRARRHHLAGHRVAEVDDRVDEGPLVVLDHVLLVRHVGHGLELGVGDVRVRQALLVAAGADDEVGQPDEDGREPADGREADQRADDRRAEQRGPVGVLHRPVLRHRLEEDEDHHDFEHDAEQHAEAAEEMLGHNADQGGRDQLADQHQQQDRVEEVGRVLHQAGQLAGAALLLVDQRLGLDPVHADEAGLGHGQDARGGQQHGDDDDEDGVLGVEARCRQQGEHAQAPWLTR